MGGMSLPLAFEASRVSMQVDERGVPWFRADEVCAALELVNPWKAVADHVDDDDLTKREAIDSLGRTQKANFVNESGVYALIFGSRKPVAKRFKRWVTSEVLPAIRQTGRYQVDGVQRVDTIPDPRAEELQAVRDCPVSEKAALRRALKLTVLAQIEDLEAMGLPRSTAIATSAFRFGVGRSTIWCWLRDVRMVPESDRAVALTPPYTGGGRLAPCHPEAWEALCGMISRPGSRVSPSIQRMRKLALRRGWSPIPSDVTLRRRLNGLRALPGAAPRPALSFTETMQ